MKNFLILCFCFLVFGNCNKNSEAIIIDNTFAKYDNKTYSAFCGFCHYIKSTAGIDSFIKTDSLSATSRIIGFSMDSIQLDGKTYKYDSIYSTNDTLKYLANCLGCPGYLYLRFIKSEKKIETGFGYIYLFEKCTSCHFKLE